MQCVGLDSIDTGDLDFEFDCSLRKTDVTFTNAMTYRLSYLPLDANTYQNSIEAFIPYLVRES